jgi:hypothetical protein
MTYIALDRRFISWNEKEASAIERLAAHWPNLDDVDWAELRKRQRVVILAEAGSGKSAELTEQVHRLTAAATFGFYSQVKDVARDGLVESWGAADRERFHTWKGSTVPGWFFVDSVDEAKLDRVQLSTALRKLADALGPDLRRAHVVLAGRITDWEFRVDLAHFTNLLPLLPPPTSPAAPEAPSVLVRALRGEYRRKSPRKPETAEPVHVVLMAPLDKSRVRQFAGGFGIADADRFMRAIEDADLWFLAQRPLDLEWLVAYWKRHGRFGTLVEMIEVSLSERLREKNPQHALEDVIDAERAREALERIGATMVFARAEKIALEDSGLSLNPTPGALRLDEVLPDWSPAHRRQLLTRAVFDPATFGCVRLHNDNEGTVRAYLAARWLRRQRDKRGSVRPLLGVLFGETYGYALARPSARQTSVWLALWDETVMREVSAREPDLLLQYGDPGSLSLSARAGMLTRVIEHMASSSERGEYLPDETLRRLASPDLAPTVRTLWEAHRAHRGCRGLLLRIITLGRISSCADLAFALVSGGELDTVTAVLAGRAVVATADSASVISYAHRVRADAVTLPGQVLWEGIDQLFPQYLSVEDFLSILQTMGPEKRDEGLGLDYFGPRCAERLHSRAELERLLSGVMVVVAGTVKEVDEAEDRRQGKHLKALGGMAAALMHFAPKEAPDIVIDVALRIRAANRHRAHDEQSQGLLESLARTLEQRRIVFWHVARAWAYPKFLQGRPLRSVWDMRILGWPSPLQLQDLDWLIADARSASAPHEAHLALDAALDVWRRDGQRAEILESIRANAVGIPELSQVLEDWLTPRTPSPAEITHQKQMDELRAERARQERKRDESWNAFVAHLQRNPDQLRQLPAPTSSTVDSRLYHLWQLLSNLDGRDRYAIDELHPIQNVVGSEVTAAFSEALQKFWREWQPTLESTRPADQRNVISSIDCIGICGVSVEARLNPGWPAYLKPEEARRAAEFATLELNGFPAWTGRLASAWPAEVGEVVAHEAIAEMKDTSATPHVGPLQDLETGPVELCRAVAARLYDALCEQEGLTERALSRVLTILDRGLPSESMSFRALLLTRAAQTHDLELAACYFAAAFYRDPEAAVRALREKLASLTPPEGRVLVECLLPRLYGDALRGRDHEPPALPLTVLESLVVIAFEVVRVCDDVARESGVVFSPGRRDSAERARDTLFHQVTLIPGPAALESLRRIAQSGATPVSAERFEALCRERAALDSDGTPWTPRAAYDYEQSTAAFEGPRTSAELQAVAVARLEDLAHELRHGDFTRGTLIQSLPDENAVQRFIGHELRQRQAPAYSLEREPHVADEKEPDIRLQARASGACLPIEIKDTDSEWTLEELETGLIKQLCGRYMRDRHDRHGIYLIVHRHPRTWRVGRGKVLGFQDVIRHLQATADRLATQGAVAPQVRVFSIDVSDMSAPSAGRPVALPKRRLKETGRRKARTRG